MDASETERLLDASRLSIVGVGKQIQTDLIGIDLLLFDAGSQGCGTSAGMCTGSVGVGESRAKQGIKFLVQRTLLTAWLLSLSLFKHQGIFGRRALVDGSEK